MACSGKIKLSLITACLEILFYIIIIRNNSFNLTNNRTWAGEIEYDDEGSSDCPMCFLGALAFFCIIVIIGMSYLAVKLARRKRAAKMQMPVSPELPVRRRLSQSKELTKSDSLEKLKPSPQKAKRTRSRETIKTSSLEMDRSQRVPQASNVISHSWSPKGELPRARTPPGSKERPVPNSLKSFFEFRIHKIARSPAKTLEECLTPSSSDECGSIRRENVSAPEVAETSPVTRSTQLETVKLDGEPNAQTASSTQHSSSRNRSTQRETQRLDEETNTYTVNSTQHTSLRNP